MRILILFLSIIFCSVANAQTSTHGPLLVVEEEDGSPSALAITVKVSDTTLTDNGDGSVSIDTSGNNTTGWTRSTNTVYLTNSTDNVGIGSTSPSQKLDVDGTVYAHSGFIFGNQTGLLRSNSGTVSVDNTVYLSNSTNIISKTVVIYDDGSWLSEEIPLLDPCVTACTIKAVRSSVLGTGTPTINFNIEERPWSTDITTSGTNITSSAMQATASGTETTSFSNASIAAKAHLVLTTASSSVVGGTTQDALVITIDYTID